MHRATNIRSWRAPDPSPDRKLKTARLTASPPLLEGRTRYERTRDLPGLLAVWPEELQAATAAEHERLIARLHAALRKERNRGTGGHWTYDLARHAHLLAAWKAEVELFRSRHGRLPETA